MFSKSTIIIAAIVAQFAGVASAVEISGTVVSAESGEPIAGVVIKLKGGDLSALTDESGRFRLSGLPSGEATLVASVIGYNVAYRTIKSGVDNAADFSLTPRLLKGQDVIVTATRAEAGQTPVAFTNVSNDEIDRKYFAQDIPMLLSHTPNLFAYSDAGNGVGYSYLKVRGFGQNRVAVMLNGVPLNDAESGEVFWIDLPDFAESVQDIQIQRGVGNSLYGAAALGGSINLVTYDYSSRPELNLKSGIGSYNTRKVLFSGNSGLINDSYVFYGRFSKIETDGYRDKSWSRMYGYFLGAAGYGERSSTKINIYGGPEESHLAYKGITKEQLDSDRRYNELQYKDEVDHFQQPHYEIINDFRLNDDVSVSNTLYYFKGTGWYDQFRSQRYLEEYNLGEIWVGAPDEFPSDYYADVDSLGNPIPDSVSGLYQLELTDLVRRRFVDEYDWGWIPRVTYEMDRGTIIGGGEVRLHNAHHYGEVLWAAAYPPDLDPNVRYYDYRGARQSYTAFGHLDYGITSRLTGMLDLQLQHYNYDLTRDKRFNAGFSRDYTFVTPRAGLNFKFNEKLTAFANVSTASRQPAFKDVYDPTDYWSNPAYKPDNFRSIGGGYIFEGKELNPEKLLDIELGGNYRGDFSGNDLDLKLNLYYMSITDEIIPYAGQIDDSGYPISGNADKTLHQGIEASARLSTSFDLEFSGNFSVNDDHFVDYVEYGFDWDQWVPIEQDRSGHRLGGFPAMIANYGISYQYRTVSLGLYGRLVGEQYLDNSEDDARKLDSYHTADLTASYDFGDEFGLQRTAFTFRVNNVFDTKYAAAGYIEPDDGMPRYMVGAERNFFLTLDLGI